MYSLKKSAGVSLIATFFIGSVTSSSCGSDQTISRDVVVVGGGASGSHAAVWLRDNGMSVVLVEKDSLLGGHTKYYTDPVSNETLNIGVQAWMQYESAYDFPTRMNVSTSGSMKFTTNTNAFIDFKTGLPVPNYAAPSSTDEYAALGVYLNLLEKYQDMLLPGYDNFPNASSIPEDLSMPFGEFVVKYGIEAAVPQLWDSTDQGLGDTMNVSTMWVMQASTTPEAKALLGTAAAAVPASGRLWDLYESVQNFLGSDVLYSTLVTESTRSDTNVTLKTINTVTGEVTCIEAKRLLMAIQPTPENLLPFDIDASEKAVFSQFQFSTLYAGILRHPSLQVNTSYNDRSAAPGSTNYTVFPVYPQLGFLTYIGGTEDLFHFTAVGTEDYDAERMKALIAQSIDNMIVAGTIPKTDGTLTFSYFADHGKMHPRLTAEVLKTGLIQEQLALQGHRSTWYTGGAFAAPFSTILWEFNKELLPNVIKGM
ncbi:FAD dependent oxidoreductase superfamily [Grosmannia clavigera kw1407]|uniref:FAD dependent oxidoreductase superfamily n=1 Tax=Grosmannia clavigera (strain kw1407 / UAMH 11150) TaxID=655863 RepID=F0XB48_GROCL|nr:FAD dependent oxidoreductase superfamily [Grosmannia clavigera kw1407]EFX05119.1 FAD dependent oxidoreductase superfamily [Grosmannia clavigera kw1407]